MSYLRDEVGFIFPVHSLQFFLRAYPRACQRVNSQILKPLLKNLLFWTLQHTVRFKRDLHRALYVISFSPVFSRSLHLLLQQAKWQGDSVCDPSGTISRNHPSHGGHQLCWAEEPRGQVQLHRWSYHPQDRTWLEYCQVRSQSEQRWNASITHFSP